MMFDTLQGLKIPEGVVTQIAKDGVVLWKLETSKPVILEVEKITSDTYAGETTYKGEEFILLDIYPKTNGTVNVTYGGLTKTITDTSGATSPNAQQVFFGTFNGVSDSVTTPASGTVTIEGQYTAFGCARFYTASKSTSDETGAIITRVVDFGTPISIPHSAFSNSKITELNIPNTVTSIGGGAFYYCKLLEKLIIPDTVKIVEEGDGFSGQAGGTFADTLKLKTAGAIGSGCNIEFGWKQTIPSYGLASGDLEHVYVPASITSINAHAFDDVVGKMIVHMLGNTPPTVGGELFYKTENDNGTVKYAFNSIVVPKGCGETYKTAEGWSTYADYIVEAS